MGLSYFARILVLALGLTLSVANWTRATEPIVIFDPDSTPTESIRAQDVELTRSQDGALEIQNGLNDRWPGIHFTGNWNLKEYSALELTIRSTSKKTIQLYCRLDSEGYDGKTMEGTQTTATSLKPGERKVWRVDMPGNMNLETRKMLVGMRGKPGGIVTDSDSREAAILFDRSKLVAIRPFETQNDRGDSWVLESIVAVPEERNGKVEYPEYLDWGPDKFFPMLDMFGQFKHADWPGKTHSLEELRAQIAIEDADLEARRPSGFSEFGGWEDGPRLEGTGAFRTEKIDGFWYLVDPQGYLFWSHGADSIATWNGTTPVTEREYLFDASTPTQKDGSEFERFLTKTSGAIHNYLEGKGEYYQYNFTEANLYLKYGDDWRSKNKTRVARRIRSWGLNTYANWNDIYLSQGTETPYVCTAGTGGGRQIEGSFGYWRKFADPFDPSFDKCLRESIERTSKTSADDPYCIGYFVDNEESWGESGSLSEAALASPKDQPAKIAYVDWLKERYGEIEKFNEAWGLSLESWDALLNEPLKTPDNENAKRDSDGFYTVIAERYFERVKSILHELAPKKLYLGCRFAWTNDLAKAAAQKYCDVVSYNIYQADAGSLAPIADAPDKPCVVGEFHFGALDRGMLHTGLYSCKDQNERAQAYKNYVENALRDPRIVGTHWFEYGDEPTTGRFDGENYQIGLVDICDVPYKETIEAVRQVGYNMYKTRDEARKAAK